MYAAQWKGDSAFLEVKWRNQKVAQIEQHDYLVAKLRSVNRADDVDAISEVYPIGVTMEQVPKPKGGLRPIAIGDGIGPGRCPRTFLPCTD